EAGDAAKIDYAVGSLAKAFGRGGAHLGPLLDRFVEAKLAGFPGAWKALSYTVTKALESASPERLRAVAERALAAPEVATVAWGIEQLIGPAHDPARDPAPHVFLAACLADARLATAC